MDSNSKNYSRDHYHHHKVNTNSQKSKQNSLKSHDSGMNDDNSPNYDSNLCESSEYLTHEVNRDDLKTQLRKSNEEREKLRLQIQKLFAEKDETCKHIAAISQAHENKITEMHCIIVELSKKLKMQQDNAIIEEPEGSASELSFQECSIICDSDSIDRQEEESDFETKDKFILQDTQNNKNINHGFPQNNYSSQIQCMQEEILQLRAKVALLKSELACKEKEMLYEYEDKPHVKDNENKSESNEVIMPPNRLNEFHESISEHYENYEVESPVNIKSKVKINEAPIAKVAERVKLKTALEHEDRFFSKEKTKVDEIFGSAEQMLASLDEIDHESTIDETYRLCRYIEQLKIQNSVLSLNLAESKQHCNHLYLLCGKYESNAVALQQALNCSDRAIEAYDVMLALLESKLAIHEQTDPIESAMQNRKVAESVAHSLLERLRTENSFYGKSAAPWAESVIFLPDSENLVWTEEHDRMLRTQVSKLKGQRSFIQNTVVNLESPFNFEESCSRSDLSSTKAQSETSFKGVDIETTILMQELMSLREELSITKNRASQIEKEKKLAYEKLKSMQNALFQLQSQLNEFGNGSSIKDRLSYSESAAAEYNASLERELLEALSRECRLKNRLQGLVSSLEVASKASINPSTKFNNDLK
ncbi:hypothetical protein PVAND_011478 [Polypedilum vanderplanki]|uniref:Harmonin-binding protein USHBP1 PDZ-binding domain-containing protein n=1 Tax=Polypedilum vanderplanki TaxID=319348 RepID=A0A9J6CK81_POLVA|nr:hypothetical protein PVAND_011478 [Polypedilum vanderplanki]